MTNQSNAAQAASQEAVLTDLEIQETLGAIFVASHPYGRRDVLGQWEWEKAAARAIESAVVSKLRAPVAGEAQPHTERNLGFNAGICVALQVVTSMDCGVTWREIVTAAGKKELLDYAANVEPEEWELAGFKKYAMSEMNERKPRKRTVTAAPQASEAVRIVFPTHLRKMWSGGDVQAWLDEHQGVTAPKPSAKGSLERYRKWQADRDEAFGFDVKAAADLVKKMVDDYDIDHGSTDPETGTREYPGEGATWVCEMRELEESIRALSAQPGAQNPHLKQHNDGSATYG